MCTVFINIHTVFLLAVTGGFNDYVECDNLSAMAARGYSSELLSLLLERMPPRHLCIRSAQPLLPLICLLLLVSLIYQLQPMEVSLNSLRSLVGKMVRMESLMVACWIYALISINGRIVFRFQGMASNSLYT